MSGNPFRKQQPAAAEVDGQKKRKVKKVQFVSPISSPNEQTSHPRFPSLEELDAPNSPPPKDLQFQNINTAALLRGDLTAGGTIDLEAHTDQENASNAPAIPHLKAPTPARRAPPPNPFARSLATAEPREKSNDGSEADRKSAMDVDTFKRLLLTGKKDELEPVEQPQLAEAEETEVLGVPKQHPTAAEEPLTESPASTSEESSSDEQDTTSPDVAAPDQRVEQQPTIVSPARTPQTMSLDDFDASTRTIDSSATSPSHEPPSTGQPDANGAKPSGSKTSLPPPPPVARRVAKITNRSRSSSGAGGPELDTAEIPPRASQTTPKPKPPPPRAPPPRVTSKEVRRPQDSQGQSNISTDSTPEPDSTQPSKIKPPPPPSRTSHKPSQPSSPKRTPSSSSSIISATPRRESSVSGSAAAAAAPAPPPPPPRARRGDKRASTDSTTTATTNGDTSSDTRRSSMMSFDRRDSISSLRRVAEDGAASQTAKDDDAEAAEEEARATAAMLADLDAFQREVDALRVKALKGK